MDETTGKNISGVAATFLSVICLVVAGQRMALGAEIAATGREQPIWVAALTVTGADAGLQETRSADTPAAPRTSAQETKSVTRQPSRKQRRRKPKMAEVPAGSPAVAQQVGQPAVQAAAQDAQKTGAPAKPSTDDGFSAADKTGPGVKTGAAAQEETDPFASAKPQATAQKTEEPDPFAAAKPAQGTKPEQQQEAKPAKSGKRYRLAPIRWGFRISETLGLERDRRSESSILNNATNSLLTQKRTFTNTQTAEIKASSYIMQPYIAQLNGSLGVVSSKENINTVTSSNGATTSNTRESKRNNKLFGSAGLGLFAKSRFPFSASYSSSDSRANSELSSDNTTSKNVNLQQSYRPPAGPSRYLLGYQNNSTTSNNSGTYSYSALNGNYSTRLGGDQDQPFSTNLRHTVSRLQEGSVTTTDMLTAQHTYLPQDSLLSLNSNAAYTRSIQSDPAQPDGARARFLQLNTFASWQPEAEDVPLYVTGTGRYFDATTSLQGTNISTKTISGSGSATYDASNNLKYQGDASATRSISRGVGDMITTQRAQAIYRSDTIKFENKSTYFWTTSGGVFNQTGGRSGGAVGTTLAGTPSSITGFNPRAFAGIGHTVSGPWEPGLLGKKIPLRYTVNQDVSANLPLSDNASQIASRSGTLRNGAGLSSSFGKDQLSGSASVNVTDIKTYGGTNPGHTRLVSIAVSGQGKQPIYEGYGAKVDGSVQVTRSPAGKMMTSAALVGIYVKQGIFGIRNLSYRGQLDITAQPNSGESATNAVQTGGAQAERKAVSYKLDQYLSYRIGQNEARLTAYLDDRNGVKHALLLLQLRAWRAIGN